MADEGGGHSLRWVFLSAAGALLLGAMALFGTAEEPAMEVVPGARPVSVEATRLVARPLRPRARLAGVLEARRGVALFAETRGRVLQIGAEELDRVEADQVLVTVDPTLAKIALERAEAALARSRSELELAQLNLERRRSLVAREVASEADLDTAENAERIAAAALREAGAMRDEARDQLAKKVIRAPFEGVLRTFSVEVGEYVQDGQQLAELLDLATVRMTVGVSDTQVVSIHPGTAVEVEVEALPGERFQGTVLRVGSATDPDTRKFPVEIEVPNPGERLLPGMVARVTLELGDEQPVLLLPRDATIDEFGLRFVYVLEPGDAGLVARRRRVQVRDVAFAPGVLRVDDGLEAGETIAVTGMRQLSDGTAVHVRETPAP
jgi:membrane fusion protein (multidrug efflux system)